MIADGLLTRFQADHLKKGKWRGYFVGPYKVLDQIGSGAEAAIYLCEHRLLQRRVAVKVLLRERAQNEAGRQRFEREARAAAALDHPNIVRAFDVGQEDRLHYIVMEYVDGTSLRKLIEEGGPLSPAKAADYLRQAALGLQHAHQAGLVHRDIKPSNLMITRDGVIKVLDLGLALLHDGIDMTRGAVLGSAAYIAPEQARDSHDVDARADIYSLGATFYLAVTGKRPTRDVKPVRPKGADPVGFDRLIAVLNRMMAPEPRDRYQSAAEVAAAVSDLAAPLPPDPPSSADIQLPPETAPKPRRAAAPVPKTPLPVAKLLPGDPPRNPARSKSRAVRAAGVAQPFHSDRGESLPMAEDVRDRGGRAQPAAALGQVWARVRPLTAAVVTHFKTHKYPPWAWAAAGVGAMILLVIFRSLF
jgi:eukaryotic-like serine/threonine-protein kinase